MDSGNGWGDNNGSFNPTDIVAKVHGPKMSKADPMMAAKSNDSNHSSSDDFVDHAINKSDGCMVVDDLPIIDDTTQNTADLRNAFQNEMDLKSVKAMEERLLHDQPSRSFNDGSVDTRDTGFLGAGKVYDIENDSGKPNVGDVIALRSRRNVKAGVYGKPGFSTTYKVGEVNEQMYVKEVIPSGRAYWVKVGYNK